ncbi:hypothetical protein J2S24_000345 [Thermoanaerobacter pentosaceus]|uniref:Uncharacterized protein n=1 Tax=Thermoanaerobacter pentosaceus TaxID=694059 RepID=A0ABT9M187_9THEO|nr:hypothetical protein [Thermoanaerobacter pentosaceus]
MLFAFAGGNKKAGCISVGVVFCVNIGYNYNNWSI